MTLIKYVCSLGGRCHTASMMKECKIKKASYPFDWIFSNLEMIIHCLEDNFNIFLDKNYYSIKDPNHYKQNHSFYAQDINEPTFNHHNPLNEKDYSYFKRCCKRFNNLLEKPDFKLFITMFLNYQKIDFTFINQILTFNKDFGKYTKNYGLLCIVHYVSNCNYHHFIKRDNVHFLEIYTTSPSNGKEFENEKDNKYFYNILTSTYQFDLNEIDEVILEEFYQEKDEEKDEEQDEEQYEEQDEELDEEQYEEQYEEQDEELDEEEEIDQDEELEEEVETDKVDE
jgi:hypothetical protein